MPIYLINPIEKRVSFIQENKEMDYKKVEEILGFKETSWISSPDKNIEGAFIDDLAHIRPEKMQFFYAPFLYADPLGNKALLITGIKKEDMILKFPLFFLETIDNPDYEKTNIPYLLKPSGNGESYKYNFKLH